MEEDQGQTPISVCESPRFMSDTQLRIHFGLSERALRVLRAGRTFPPRDSLIGKTDRKAVDLFFDRRAGIGGGGDYQHVGDGVEDFSEVGNASGGATPLLTPAQAAVYLGIGEDTLAEMRKAGEVRYVNIGRGLVRATPRYDVTDLDNWITRNRREEKPQSIRETSPRRTRTSTDSAIAEYEAAKKRLLKRK